MCDTLQMLDAIGDLTGAFRPPSTEVETKAFVTALEGIPVQFIEHAARNFLQGSVANYNPRFCPSPPQLAIEARRLAENLSVRDLVALNSTHPDFKAVEKLRGQKILTGRYGTATIKKTEIEEARRALR